jgi:prepilin-type N-terminal cleavage/methylation domain-containing protein
MLQKYKTKREEGFTIIEVLIVLAIAGLILLIVFLAIPALQRNQRNNARNSDASRISAAVTECLSNRNGNTAACGDDTIDELAGDRSQLETIGAAALDEAAVTYGSVCDTNGENTEAAPDGVSSRAFAVTFQIETRTGELNRCIESQ